MKRKRGVFKNTFKLLIFLSILFTPLFSNAQIIHSTEQGGSWNDPSTWEEGIVPTENDDVVLKTKVFLPNKVKVKSIKLETGDFIFYNNSNIEITDFFEIGKNATFSTTTDYGLHKFNIKTNKFINNGMIKYPLTLNLDGNFINNGEVGTIKHSSLNNILWRSKIYISGNIENNVLIDKTFFCFTLKPNTENNKYYIYGKKPANICINSGNNLGEYYFRRDLNLNLFKNIRGLNRIFLDNGRVLKITKGYGYFKISNQNKIILGKAEGYLDANWNIDAINSDIFVVDSSRIGNLKAKNIYITNNSTIYHSYSMGISAVKNIFIEKGSSLKLKGGRINGKYVSIKSNKIYNYGNIISFYDFAIYGKLYNFGTIKKSGYGTIDVLLKDDLFNYPEGKIFVDISYKDTDDSIDNNKSIKIINKGYNYWVKLFKDIEFDPETNFNFRLYCYNHKITLSTDTEIKRGLNRCNFKSKNGNILNLKLHTGAVIGDWKNFNLIFELEKKSSLIFDENSNFHKLIVKPNSNIVVIGKKGPFALLNHYNSYLNGDVINNGEILFWNYYGDLRSYFHKTIKNNGIVKGATVWEFPDKRKFKYLISENEVLTDEEKTTLENSNIVSHTGNLVPRLSEIDKHYYIHVQEVDDSNQTIGEERNIELNKDVEEPEENFSESNLPDVNESIPNLSEPGDKTAPVIQLNGSKNIVLNLGEEYIEEGATAVDDIDGDLTNQIQITGEVNWNQIGTYTITYSVSDLSGNTSAKTRTVIIQNPDQTPPVISLNGDKIINLKAGEEYTELGATAIDETDGGISDRIQITGEVDTNHTGIYEIKYSVSDTAGNQTEIIRTVKISGGNSSVGLPGSGGSTGDSPNSGSSKRHHGHSGKIHRSKTKDGKVIYNCKDSRAINFSNVGKHKEELCIYKKNQELRIKNQEEEKKEEDFASQNPPKEKENKQEEEKEKYLLISTCLNLKSKEKSIKKYSKDKIAVRQLQSFLKKYEYLEGKVDGAFGTITKTSLIQFQKDNKLYPDGILGKGTIKWIDESCRFIKNREYFVKKREEEKRKEEQEKEKKKQEEEQKKEGKKEKDFNIEKKEKIKNKIIEAIKKEKEKIKEETYQDNLRLSNELRNILAKSKGPAEAFGTFTTLTIGGLYGATNNLWGKTKEGVVGLRQWVKEKWTGKEEKEFFFKIHNDTANLKKHDPNKETIIIIHGFQSEPKDWVQDIANGYDNKNREILLLNWKDIVSSYSYSEAVSSVSKVEPKLKANLINWKIDINKTTIISHSLGTILAGELSKDLGKVKELVALDPAIGTGRENDFFQNKAQTTKCISTWGSDLSNEQFLNYCNQSFLIKSQSVKVPIFAKHSLTHNVFKQILYQNTLYNNTIIKNNLPEHDILKAEVEDEKKINIDGFLNAENIISKELKYLELKNNNKNIFLGSSIDNNFTCEEGICEFYGWKGQDKLYLNKSASLSYFKDFKRNKDDDFIFIKKGYSDIQVKEKGKKKVVLFARYKNGWKYVVLEGVSEGDIKKWVEDAKNKDGLIDDEDYQKLPIQIKQ